ncbi:MAG: hypothetical protein SCH66_10445 [Methanolobus sp.]|nr:hypothetical protein [Methanolobus sp.]
MGEDENDSKPKKNTPERPEEKKASYRHSKPESGPILPIFPQQGVEDSDMISFGDIQDGLYVVEADDSRPKRLNMKGPPGLKSGREVTSDDSKKGSYVARPTGKSKKDLKSSGNSK